MPDATDIAESVRLRLAYWQALYEENNEPLKPIPPHVVTIWENGEMRLVDGGES